MPPHLCLSFTFLDPEAAFHGCGDGGDPEWPPSPWRVFSALVATAAARAPGDALDAVLPALRWLEVQLPPAVVAPAHQEGSPVRIAVPNNDLDVVAAAWSQGREPAKQPAELKTLKTVRPTRLVGGDTVHYLWPLPDSTFDPAHEHAHTLAEIARSVVALGWGVDMVSGYGRVLTDEEVAALSGVRWQPSGARGVRLRVPGPGTLDDLRQRYQAFLTRVSLDDRHFSPVPPPQTYRLVGYRNSLESVGWSYAAFSLLRLDGEGFRAFDPVRHTGRVAGMVRHAVGQAATAAGWPVDRIATFVHGHTPDGRDRARGGPDLPRFAYVPLPSLERRGQVGGVHVGPIRRVLVLAPPGNEATLHWLRRALSGQELIDEDSQEPCALLSVLPQRDPQLRPYLDDTECWSTVTPLVLPGHDDGDPRQAERLLRKALVHSGLSAELAREAELEWRLVGYRAGVELATRYATPACYRGRLRYHLRVRWWAAGRALRLAGPLLVGAGRYGGYGLLAGEP